MKFSEKNYNLEKCFHFVTENREEHLKLYVLVLTNYSEENNFVATKVGDFIFDERSKYPLGQHQFLCLVHIFQNVATTEAFSSPQEVKQKEENVTKYQLSTSQNQKMSTQYNHIKIYFHNYKYSNLYQLVFFQFKKTLSSSWDIETADLNKMTIARMITPKRTNFVFGEAIFVSFLTEIQRAPKIYTGINLCAS